MPSSIDSRWSRRRLLMASLGIAGTLLLPRRLRAAAERAGLPKAVQRALAQSPLIYVSPLRHDGSESRCHAEVWFVPDGGDVLVSTARERWRARAIRKGLREARVWLGDFGVWKKSDRFKSGPSVLATATLETDAAVRARALQAFGKKYADAWDKWGPRFRKGLADGSRVLIRYHLKTP